ncbi:hypothetical protein D3C76_1247130 [compost metagenome]
MGLKRPGCTLQLVRVPDVVLIGKGDEVIPAEVNIADQSEEITRSTAKTASVRQHNNPGMLSSISHTPGFGSVDGGVDTDIDGYIDCRLTENGSQLFLDPLHAIIGSQQNRNLGMFYWHVFSACTTDCYCSKG